MKSKRILFTTPFFPPYDIGGMELSLKLLAESLASAGWEVTIATPGYGEKALRFDGKNPRVLYMPWKDKRTPSSLFTPQAAKRFVAAVLATVEKPEIIDSYAWPQPGVLLKEAWNIPLVASIRDASFISDMRGEAIPRRLPLAPYMRTRLKANGLSPAQLAYGLYGYWRTSYTWKSLQKADFIAYASNALRDLFRDLSVPGAAVFSVSNPEGFKPPRAVIEGRDDTLPLFVYAGRLSTGKGAQYAYDSAAALLDGGKRFQLAFVGKGELRTRPELSRNFLFLGRKSREETLGILSQATATLVPSLVFEGFPRAGIESISVGTPVIGTNIGGIPEAVGEAGIITDASDRSALATAMKRLVDDPELVKSLREKANREASLYSPDAMRKRVEKIYTSLLT